MSGLSTQGHRHTNPSNSTFNEGGRGGFLVMEQDNHRSVPIPTHHW